MKLLFDQNISFRIVSKITNEFPEAKQVRQIGIENFSDMEIWQYAKTHNYVIVSFDSDFFDISSLKGHPPKIIWLRTGNTTTDYLAQVVISKASIIKDFITKEVYQDIACLEIK